MLLKLNMILSFKGPVSVHNIFHIQQQSAKLLLLALLLLLPFRLNTKIS